MDQVLFIGALYVVLTPIAIAILRRRRPHPAVYAAVIMSVIGIALLTGRETLPTKIGFLWAIIAAFCITGQIMAISSGAQRVPALALTALQCAGAALPPLILTAVQALMQPHALSAAHTPHATVWLWIGYLGVIATGGAL